MPTGPAPQQPHTAQWFDCKTPCQAITLLIHGLNLNPLRMDPLAQALCQSGHRVLRGVLRGHRGNLQEQQTLCRQDWHQDIQKLIQEAQALAQKEQKPFYLMAYSLGALVSLDFLAKTRPPNAPEKFFFIAPAISLRWYSYFIEFLWFLPDHFGIPSQSLPEYRSSPVTTMAAYRALRLCQKELKKELKQNGAGLLNCPTLIFIDPKDELVSPTGLDHFIRLNHLQNWKLHLTSNQDHLLPKSFHHLIIDRENLGGPRWQKLLTAFRQHFSGQKTP